MTLRLAGRTIDARRLADLSAGNRARISQYEAGRSAQAIERRRVASGIPPAFAGLTLELLPDRSSEANAIRDALGDYCHHFEEQRTQRNGLLFSGRAGTGKTEMACAMGNTLLDNGYTVLYESMPSLAIAIKNAYREGEPVAAIVNRLSSADLFIIDNIDVHGTSDSEYQALYDVIDTRAMSGRHPTIAISQRSLPEVSADLGEAVVSRITSGYGAVIFQAMPAQRSKGVPQ